MLSSRQHQQVMNLLHEQSAVERLFRMTTLAERRGWPLAAASVRRDRGVAIGRLQSQAAQVLQQPAEPPPAVTLRSLLEDLRQLETEFDGVELVQQPSRVVVQTDPITLEDLDLGCFSIELELDRLARRRDASCFVCVALEPHPPTSQDNVTHPHVRDGELCAGDAAVPIASALRDGGIADAFTLISRVLHTYNAHSPYVAIGDWEGVSCSDCGHSTGPENLYRCEHCENDCCDACSGCCDICDQSCCQGCLDRDSRRSVALELLGGRRHVAVGHVTIPSNYAIPSPGEIAQVKYLYAYRGGCLYQPVYLGRRDGLAGADCTIGQLKFKSDGDERAA